MDIAIILAVIAVVALALVLFVWLKGIGKGFKVEDVLVRIDDDGVAHELTTDEIEYLETPFLGGDGGRPYIKDRYDRLTPDGRIGGFLYRNALPKGSKVVSRP
jgi:hypothetical protein